MGTVDAGGCTWSPDGTLFAVWDYAAEFRLLVYTALGTLRFSYMVGPEAVKPSTILPLTTSSVHNHLPINERKSTKLPPMSKSDELIVAPSAGSTRAQRVVHTTRSTSTTPIRPKSTKLLPNDSSTTATLPKHAGGGLGIRQVNWSPKGNMLALGGYDEKVPYCPSLHLALGTTKQELTQFLCFLLYLSVDSST